MIRGQRRTLLLLGIAAGGVLGIVYSLSPLTCLSLPALVWLTGWVVRGRSERERRWVVSLVTVAVALRLLAIAVLFITASPDQPFATFFGDEEFFKHRSMWRRNVGLDLPISPADTIYLFDDVGWSSYLFILAFIQALTGAAPYGVHVLNATLYVASVLLIYRLVRPSYGGVAAITSLALLLFWPTLFVWSISALKEASYAFVAALELWAAVAMMRAATWGRAAAALAAVVACTIVLESIRRGGMEMILPGAVLGAALGALVPRPRLALASLALAPLIVIAALNVPPIQDRALAALRRGAYYHAGHVVSTGIAYQLIEPRYYFEFRFIQQMTPRELAEYVVKATASYFVEPLPWHAESRMLRGYLPEQMAWLLLVALAMAGVVGAFRLDVPLTAMLIGHAVMAVMVVALTSGNIGTLIRHRGLAMAYLAWLAGVGLCEVVRLTGRAADDGRHTGEPYGVR